MTPPTTAKPDPLTPVLERLASAAGFTTNGTLATDELVDELELELTGQQIARASLEARVERLEEPSGAEGLLIAALAKAQAKFPPIPKTKTATVVSQKGNYAYQYADLADVLEVIRPVLANEGLVIVQRTTYVDGGRLMLLTELRHHAGATLTTEVALDARPDSPQQFGGALTYLRRYELVTLLGVQADEDADAHNTAQPDARRDAVDVPALPPWAQEATEPRKRELITALEPLIGRTAAKELAGAVKTSLGHVPDVIVGFARGVRATMDAQAAGAAAPAQAERARQDAAANQPDRPSPEPAPDPPAEEDALTPEQEAELARLNAGLDDAPPDKPAPPRPAPATVEAPELPKDPGQAIGVLKAAGCICPDPLGIRGEHPTTDDTCPISGHGIPF